MYVFGLLFYVSPLNLQGLAWNFLPPSRIVEEVEPHAFVLVVGVHSVCSFGLPRSPIVLALSLAHIGAAAPSYILATTSNPHGCVSQVVKDAELSEVVHRHHSLATSACGVWSFGRSVLFEVLPSSCSAFLCSFAHILAPPLALVVWFVTFEELSVALVVLWSLRR